MDRRSGVASWGSDTTASRETQSELETAKLDVAQFKAKAAEVAGSFASLNAAEIAEGANCEMNPIAASQHRRLVFAKVNAVAGN